jgi:hypothetical protein
MARLFFLALCMAPIAHPEALAGAEPIDITTSRQGRMVAIGMHATVLAPQSVIWATLTDYDNTAKWITGMDRSVVLQRKPGRVVVEQSGSADILFFTIMLNVVLEVEEDPPGRIGVKLVRGDFRHLEGEYLLTSVPGVRDRYDLTWKGKLELASPVPGFLAQPLLKENVRLRFESLVAEIERRARAAQE